MTAMTMSAMNQAALHSSINITEDESPLLEKQDSIRFSQSNFLYRHGEDDPIDAHYTLGELLGEGGFGVVYRGTHKQTGAQRAIKQMEKHPKDEELNKEVIQEFCFLKELDHPNLIRVYDMFEDKPNFHIVTDLYGGGDLIDYLDFVGHPSEPQVLIFMNKLLSCMEYLHDTRRMVHRDLKLENILLDADQDLADMKLIDFGLARHFTPEEQFYELVGSTAYVAPQVIEGTYTAKCDIWSCGVIAFCLLSGYTPFEGYDDGETLQAILVGRFDFNDPAWNGISEGAKDFICNLLAYEEAERPTARQALAHPWLRAYRNNEMDESSNDMDTSLRESLKGLIHFTSKGCKLKQAACALIASQLLQKEEKEALKEDFAFLNRSMGGSITRDDLQEVLAMLRYDSSDVAVDSIMEQVNFSGSGSISYSEFTIAMMFERDMVDEAKLKLVFNLMDQDGDGLISNKDLQKTVNLSEESCAKMLKPLKTDGNGRLSFEEFVHAILSDESMDGSNFFLNSLMEDDTLGARRTRLGSASGGDLMTVEEDDNIPEESAHTTQPVAEQKDDSTSRTAKATDDEVPGLTEPAPVVEPEPVKEPEQPPTEPEKPSEPEKPAESEQPAEPEGMSADHKRLCFMWYMRFGYPDKKTMIRRAKKMGDQCPLTTEDIEALPWSCGGALIPVRAINEAHATNVTKSGDITNRKSSRKVESDANKIASEVAVAVEAETLASNDEAKPAAATKVEEQPTKAAAVVSKASPPEAKPVEPVKAAEPPVKPSEVKAAQRSSFVKPYLYNYTGPMGAPGSDKIKATRTNSNVSNKAPLKVSSVLVGVAPNNALKTELKVDPEHSEYGKTEILVRTREAGPRKENTIFATNKKAPDFDWATVENTTLKIASVEERKTIKAEQEQDFEWNCIAKTDKSMEEDESDAFDKNKIASTSASESDRMSRADSGKTEQRRSTSLIWTPGSKSEDSQKMVFPKNDRRRSTASKGKGRRESNKRRVSTKN